MGGVRAASAPPPADSAFLPPPRTPTPTHTQVEKKDYYHVFRLAGFVGFDGDFKG